jgi:hypothetical protein
MPRVAHYSAGLARLWLRHENDPNTSSRTANLPPRDDRRAPPRPRFDPTRPRPNHAADPQHSRELRAAPPASNAGHAGRARGRAQVHRRRLLRACRGHRRCVLSTTRLSGVSGRSSTAGRRCRRRRRRAWPCYSPPHTHLAASSPRGRDRATPRGTPRPHSEKRRRPVTTSPLSTSLPSHALPASPGVRHTIKSGVHTKMAVPRQDIWRHTREQQDHRGERGPRP